MQVVAASLGEIDIAGADSGANRNVVPSLHAALVSSARVHVIAVLEHHPDVPLFVAPHAPIILRAKQAAFL